MAARFPCLSLFGWTKDYSFLTETNKCFSGRMYTCLEFRTDQNLFTRRRTKFTAISTRFMNLDCESPIHAALEHNYSNIYSDADTQTQIAHTRFTRKFLGGYFWAALLFIIVVVVVVIDMMITIMMLMTMTTPTTTTTTTTMPMSTPTQPLSSSSSHDSYPESSSIASASRVWLATGRVCRKRVM